MLEEDDDQILEELESVVILFAGDSGDGMQTVGELFTDTCAHSGFNMSTLPDYPAEIRAPAGTIAGVSGFQVHLGSAPVLSGGDAAEVLIAMNPAALNANLDRVVPGGMIVVNIGAFTDENIRMAEFESNPLDDEVLNERFEIVKVNLNELTKHALADMDLKMKDKMRCKNFFALGFMFWVYHQPLTDTLNFLEKKWGKKRPQLVEANAKALRGGHNYGETYEGARNRYQIAKTQVKPGVYRKISGNQAIAYGLVAASQACARPLTYPSYPITPATSILETLAALKHFNVKTIQAEDEIAAAGIALGASWAGDLAVTGTSGPGMCLKSEFLGLAVITELPMVICNVQRAGPSTGLPTKVEQADLLQAIYGRHGECPLPVVSCSTPGDGYYAAIEAVRIAIKYKTPVILLSDAYVANGSEPWRVPSVEDLPDLRVEEAEEPKDGEKYLPYKRDPETLARKLAFPGQKGNEHRIGGLEKNESGAISYSPDNHEEMVNLRAKKIQGIAKSYEPIKINGKAKGKVLVLGWGGTYGAITAAMNNLIAEGYPVASVHIHHLFPLPLDLKDILNSYDKVLIPELNSGQLNMMIRAEYLIDTISYPKVKGQPFTVTEITTKVLELLN